MTPRFLSADACCRAASEVLAIAACLVAGGCTIGPKYNRPVSDVPKFYKETTADQQQPLPPWNPAQPADQQARGKWWEVFDDPQLNALEEKVDLSNQALSTAEAQYREARALVRLARSAYYPLVTGGIGVRSERFSINRPLSFGTSGPYGDYLASVTASWEPDVWGRVRQSVESARTSSQAAAADVETVRLSIEADLAADYFELRSFDAEKQLLDSTVAAYEKALELTQNRYSGGAASQAEVAQAQTQLETTRAQAIDVGTQRAIFEHAIAVLTGQPSSSFSVPVAPLEKQPPAIPSGVPSDLLQRRPDIAAAERRVASANAQVGVAQTAYYPAFMLTAAGGFEGAGIVHWLEWPSRLWSVGPAVAQTLLDFGARRAVSERAYAAYDATVSSYRETVLGAFQEVEDNLALLRILAEEAQKQNDAVQAAERSLTFSTNRYRGGVVTYLEVVTAQTAALSNERIAVDIHRRRMVAAVRLVKALGGGWNAAALPTG